jgi:hypothetical protein
MVKQFNLPATPHTLVKVVFTFHFFGSWDKSEFGYGAFSTDKTQLRFIGGRNDEDLQVGWYKTVGTQLIPAFTAPSLSPSIASYSVQAEMVAQTPYNRFWVIFGTNSDELATNESYGISNIQIWVR